MISDILLRSPIVVVKGNPICRDCPETTTFRGPDAGHHTPVRECEPGGPGTFCDDPSVHHPYRPRRWWETIRRWDPWRDRWRE